MEVSKKLSKRIKAYRENRNLSQAACSQELGVAKSTLQKLERGETVAPQTLQYVAERLGMVLSLRPQDSPEYHAREAEAVGRLIAAAKEVLELLETGEWS